LSEESDTEINSDLPSMNCLFRQEQFNKSMGMNNKKPTPFVTNLILFKFKFEPDV
jgi:hypothetical protein